MKQIITGMLAVSLLALALGACDDGHGDDYGYAYPASTYCAQYTTCGSCTPVIGCGWCYNGAGAGTCASDPDQCTGSQFSWTWEATGCHVPADASPNDAGVTPPPSDAAVSDALGVPETAPPPADAASNDGASP